RIRSEATRLGQAAVEGNEYVVPTLRRDQVTDNCWVVESASLDEAVQFGVLLLRKLEDRFEKGNFLLKPALATGWGEPPEDRNAPLDPASKRIAEVAFSIAPFSYALLTDPGDPSGRATWFESAVATVKGAPVWFVDWRRARFPNEEAMVWYNSSV